MGVLAIIADISAIFSGAKKRRARPNGKLCVLARTIYANDIFVLPASDSERKRIDKRPNPALTPIFGKHRNSQLRSPRRLRFLTRLLSKSCKLPNHGSNDERGVGCLVLLQAHAGDLLELYF